MAGLPSVQHPAKGLTVGAGTGGVETATRPAAVEPYFVSVSRLDASYLG